MAKTVEDFSGYPLLMTGDWGFRIAHSIFCRIGRSDVTCIAFCAYHPPSAGFIALMDAKSNVRTMHVPTDSHTHTQTLTNNCTKLHSTLNPSSVCVCVELLVRIAQCVCVCVWNHARAIFSGNCVLRPSFSGGSRMVGFDGCCVFLMWCAYNMCNGYVGSTSQ